MSQKRQRVRRSENNVIVTAQNRWGGG